jgi:hypothetical protein
MAIGKRKRKLLKILAAVIVLFIIGRIIDNQLNKPAQGTVIDEQPTSQANLANNSFNLSPASVSGQYASFSYPKVMTKLAPSGLSGSEVATYSYKYKDIETWILAIEILKVPSGNLNDNSAWMLRKDNPSIYQETDNTINGQAVMIMTDTSASGFAKVAFLINGEYQAMIALTGDDPSGTTNLGAVFNQVVGSWSWNI